MNHEEWTSQLSDYVDGELDAPARDAVAMHLQTCEECTRIVGELERVKSWARENVPGPAPTDPWPLIRREIESRSARAADEAEVGGEETSEAPQVVDGAHVPRRGFSKPLRHRLPAPALIAALLVVVAGSVWWLSPDLPEKPVGEHRGLPAADAYRAEPAGPTGGTGKMRETADDEDAGGATHSEATKLEKRSDATGSADAPAQEPAREGRSELSRRSTSESPPASVPPSEEKEAETAPDSSPTGYAKMFVQDTEPEEARVTGATQNSPAARLEAESESIAGAQALDAAAGEGAEPLPENYEAVVSTLLTTYMKHRDELAPTDARAIGRRLEGLNADIARADSVLVIDPSDVDARKMRTDRRREKLRLLRALVFRFAPER